LNNSHLIPKAIVEEWEKVNTHLFVKKWGWDKLKRVLFVGL